MRADRGLALWSDPLPIPFIGGPSSRFACDLPARRARPPPTGSLADGEGITREIKPGGSEPSNTSGPGAIWKLITGLAILAALILAGREGAGVVSALLDTVRDLGPWTAVAFVAIYAAATVAWVPGSLMTLAAGAIFGLVEGTIYTLIGATLGASLAFLVGRYLARSAVERRLGASLKLRAVDEAVARKGAKVVFLGAGPRGAGYYTLLGVGLAATIAVTVLVTRTARRALHHSADVSTDMDGDQP